MNDAFLCHFPIMRTKAFRQTWEETVFVYPIHIAWLGATIKWASCKRSYTLQLLVIGLNHGSYLPLRVISGKPICLSMNFWILNLVKLGWFVGFFNVCVIVWKSMIRKRTHLYVLVFSIENEGYLYKIMIKSKKMSYIIKEVNFPDWISLSFFLFWYIGRSWMLLLTISWILYWFVSTWYLSPVLVLVSHFLFF